MKQKIPLHISDVASVSQATGMASFHHYLTMKNAI